MNDDNLMLYVAAYDDADSARQDFEALKALEGPDLEVVGAVVMNRDADVNVDVLEVGDGDTAGGAVIGGGIGLVVGLFAPPLLLSTAIGAGIGAVLGHLTKKHEEKELGVDLDDYLPLDSSAVAVVIEDIYLDRVEAALDKSAKKISKAIDKGDYDKLRKAVQKGEKRVGDAIDS